MPKRKQIVEGKSPFSMRLASLRKEKGLNMDSLAQQVGVSKSFISLLESGGRQPSRDVVLQLAKVLAETETDKLRDELLILAGFAPVNTRAIAAYQDAIAVYEQTLLSEPSNFKLYSRLIMALIKANRQTQAQERIQQGLQQFKDVVQLQSLLAQLELSKGNFDAALINQETALRQFNLPGQSTQVSQSDLIFNLGAIHFLRGYEALGHYLQDHLEPQKQVPINYFNAAESNFEQALQLAPDDVYVLDELARLRFNQAYLLQSAEAWQITIQTYRQLLTSPLKHNLGSQPLMESAAFLAHAYTKNKEFDQAELTLGLLSAFNHSYWLVHYLEACLHSQRFEVQQSSLDLDLALAALARAFASEGQEQARAEALHDPDLQALRTERQAEFVSLLNVLNKETIES